MKFETIQDVKEHFEQNQYPEEVYRAINFLLGKVNDVKINEFKGRTITDFYCNGFFGRRYDLSGSEIIESGSNYIKIIDNDGDEETTYFEEGWQLQEIRELVDAWTNGY